MIKNGVSRIITSLVTRRGGWVLTIFTFISLLSIPQLLHLSFEESLLELLPGRSRTINDFSTYMRNFSMEDALVILVECNERGRLIAFTEAFASKLKAHPLIKGVQYRAGLHWEGGNPLRYLFNMLDRGEMEEILVRFSRPALERSVEEMRSIIITYSSPVSMKYFAFDPLGLLPVLSRHLSTEGLPVDPASGYYLSKEGDALLMIVRPTRSSYEISFDRMLLKTIRMIEDEVLRKTQEGDEIKVSYTGSYVYALSYAMNLRRDFMVISILSMGGLLLVLYLFFHNIVLIPIVLLSLFMISLWTLVIAGVIFGSLNMISIAFATIVMGIGIDLAIHFYSRFREEIRQNEMERAIEEVILKAGNPMLSAVMTTSFVFLVFSLSSIRGISQLGILCGIGMLVSLVTMILLFPSMLVLAMKYRLLDPIKGQGKERQELEGRISRFCTENAGKVILIAIILLFPMIWYAKGVKFEQTIKGLEPRNFMPAIVTERIRELFGKRGERLTIMIKDQDIERALQKNDLLKDDLQEMVRSSLIISFDSLSLFLPSQRRQKENLAILQSLDRDRVIADMKDVLRQKGFPTEPFEGFFKNFREAGSGLLSLRDLGKEGFQHLIRNYLRMEGRDHILATYVYCKGRQELIDAYHIISKMEREWSKGAIITGFPLVEMEFGRIVKEDFRSLSLISIVVVLVVLTIQFRRLKDVFLMFFSLFWAAVSFLALVAIMGVSINLFNLIVIPLVFGIGVDGHIYILHRFILEKKTNGIGRAVIRCGRAILASSITTIIAFSALMISRFEGLCILGLMAIIGIVLSLITAFVVLPFLISFFYRKEEENHLERGR